MRHLATAEEDRRLDLVTFAQEALDVLLLELVVMLIDLGPELDLLDLDHLLMLLGLARSFLFLVLILPEVHDPADRRHRSRGDLDEVESLLTCDDERLRRRHDPELLTGFVDHPDLTDPDALIGTNAVITSGRAIECDNVLLGLQNLPTDLFERVRHERLDRPCTEVSARTTPNGNGPLRGLPIAGHEHVRHLRQLGLSDFKPNLPLPIVQVHTQPGGGQRVADACRIVPVAIGNREHYCLYGRQPQRPSPRK